MGLTYLGILTGVGLVEVVFLGPPDSLSAAIGSFGRLVMGRLPAVRPMCAAFGKEVPGLLKRKKGERGSFRW